MATIRAGVWGIDLGQCALKAIRLENVDGQVKATAFDYIEHPKILSQPDADPDQLTREALEQFLSRNSIKGDVVVISVPGQSGLARFVKLPPVEEKKIADIVRFEAKQQIPFPLDEVVWDFQKIGSGVVTDGFAMETEIGLFAMKRDMVNRYLQHFKDVNVEVHQVQMAPLALCNFISYDQLGKGQPGEGAGEEAGKKECVVALDIGTDNSNLVITDGERIIWQRPIPLGGNHFTRSLTKDLKLTFAKAEHLKRNAVKSPDLKKILAALKTVLNDFVGEVQRSLGYFTNTHRDAQIKYMVGLGNAFRLPGLQKFLQEKLQLEMRKLQKLERLEGEEVLAAPQFNENILSFGVAYGLALQGLKVTRLQTNLLPQEIRMERMIRGKKPWAAAAAAILLLAVGSLTFARNNQWRAVDNDTGPNKTALTKSKSLQDELKGYRTKYDQAEKDWKDSIFSIQKIGSGARERFNWDLIYKYVNMALPQPNGDKVPERTREQVPARQRYVTAKAGEAYKLALAKQFASYTGKSIDTKPSAKTENLPPDEFIKKYLIQVNIEGVGSMYFEDLPEDYFKAIAKEQLDGMHPNQQKIVRGESKDGQLPKKGWVVEIRGYTHQFDADRFVANTFLENLVNPKGVGNRLTPEMIEKVENRIGFLWIKQEKVNNPEAGNFKFIRTSYLRQLVGGGGAGGGLFPGGALMQGGISQVKAKLDEAKSGAAEADAPAKGAGEKRAGWQPIGEIAATVFGGGGGMAGGNVPGGFPNMVPGGAGGKDFKDMIMKVMPNVKPNAAPTPAGGKSGGARQPRTEFVVLFVWLEPTIEDASATTTETPPAEAPKKN
jgi:type IV pilus assembly protein PilM